MTWLLSLIMGAGVPAKLARPVLYAIAAVMLLGALWGAKCAYDKRVIATHEAKQEASTAKADRKADTNAAEQRRADDSRIVNESDQLGKAQANAKTDLDRRLARNRCIRLQQAARRDGKLAPTCA